MNIKSLFLTAMAALALTIGAQAQTTATNSVPLPDTGFLSQLDITATNWVLIPYAAYQIEAKRFGGGAAALYMASPNLWTGVRVESIDGRNTTAGVQAQIQATIKVFSLTVTPFLETSVGLGNDNLYGTAGAGGIIGLHSWTVGKSTISLSLIGCYEHYVDGGVKSGNQVEAGLVGRFAF